MLLKCLLAVFEYAVKSINHNHMPNPTARARAKFFEARADLMSAIVTGEPRVLAKALEKIGSKRLLYERSRTFRFQEWISLDPHPPIYFRVSRLEKLQAPVKIRYPLAQSAKEVIRGFLASF